MKKVIAILLTLTVLFTLCLSACVFAAEALPTEETTEAPETDDATALPDDEDGTPSDDGDATPSDDGDDVTPSDDGETTPSGNTQRSRKSLIMQHIN